MTAKTSLHATLAASALLLAATAPAGAPPRAAAAQPPAGQAAAVDETFAASRWGVSSPRYQIRVLHSAANVLAHRGDERGCEAVVAQLHSVYSNYITQVKQEGLDPNEVTSWRQERIVAARPVTELDTGMFKADDVTGTEIRNAPDEKLGTINDVIIDSSSGGIRYVIVARGGILGIGREHVAVPWDALKATAGLNTFVLNVPKQVIDQAPKINPDRFANPTQGVQYRQQVDAFRQQHRQG